MERIGISDRRAVGRDAWLSFVRRYIAAFARKTITSHEFKAFFQHTFPTVSSVDWDAWLHAYGDVPEKLKLDSSLAVAGQQLAAAWLAGSSAPRPTTVFSNSTFGV